MRRRRGYWGDRPARHFGLRSLSLGHERQGVHQSFDDCSPACIKVRSVVRFASPVYDPLVDWPPIRKYVRGYRGSRGLRVRSGYPQKNPANATLGKNSADVDQGDTVENINSFVGVWCRHRSGRLLHRFRQQVFGCIGPDFHQPTLLAFNVAGSCDRGMARSI